MVSKEEIDNFQKFDLLNKYKLIAENVSLANFNY